MQSIRFALTLVVTLVVAVACGAVPEEVDPRDEYIAELEADRAEASEEIASLLAEIADLQAPRAYVRHRPLVTCVIPSSPSRD